jgi:hypothetical protein
VDTLLTLLKYAGALIAGATVLLGIYLKFSAGQWKLTRADWAGAVLAMAGVLISLGSIHVQNRQAEQAAERQAQREAEAERRAAAESAERQRERLASTPLTELDIEWRFTGAPGPAPAVKERPEDRPGRACTEFEAERLAERRYGFYPFLFSLSGARASLRPVVLLIALDDAAASVLPLGVLDAAPLRPRKGRPPDEDSLEWRITRPARLAGVAATIDFAQDLVLCSDLTRRDPVVPALARPRRCDLVTKYERRDDEVVLRWALSAACLAAGVDRAHSSEGPKAALPEHLTALLLTDIGDFPRDPQNFAAWGSELPWKAPVGRGGGLRAGSRLTLTPNRQPAHAVTYEMGVRNPTLLGGKAGGGDIGTAFPLVTVFRGRRVS